MYEKDEPRDISICSNNTGGTLTAQDFNPKEDSLALAWISNMLSVLDKNLDENMKTKIFQQCSDAHYRSANMGEITSRYKGNIEGFIQYVMDEWGWIVKYDKESKMIIADENKSYCACPLIKRGQEYISETLCHCSEGFAERMFSAVTGNPVKAVVLKSVLKGDASCIYSIILDEKNF